MLRVVRGNIFASRCHVLVNAVNCVGVMNAGVALEFRLRYPEMFARYADLCRSGALDIGDLWYYDEPTEREPGRGVLNFPTKKHWKDPSREEYLREGLKRFLGSYEDMGIESAAFPVLGSGGGGIHEGRSVEIMTGHLYDCGVDIEIYVHDPAAEDDLFPVLKRMLASGTDAQIARETGLRAERVSAIRGILANRSRLHMRNVGRVASARGIGERTVERIYEILVGRMRIGEEALSRLGDRQNSPVSDEEFLQLELFQTD